MIARRLERDASLAAILKPDLTLSECTLAQVEGWILCMRHGAPVA